MSAALVKILDAFVGFYSERFGRNPVARPPGYYTEQERAQQADEQRRADQKARTEIQKQLRRDLGKETP